MKPIITIFLITVCLSRAYGQEYNLLRGYVTDTTATPIPGVLVRLKNGGGTITDNAGKYELRLSKGVHRLSFQYVGYNSTQIDQLINDNTTLNVTLYEDAGQLQTVTITNKRRDYSYQVIQKAVEAKELYQRQYINQKRTVYVKSKEKITSTKKDKSDQKAPTLEEIMEKERDSLSNLNYFEGKFIQHTQPPHDFKQVKVAAKRINSQQTLMYTNTTDADFNFYNNFLTIKKLGDNAYVSPLSNTTFLSYKFKLLGSAFENGAKYFKIQVKPRKIGNALFSGELHIWDSTWRLKYVNFSLPNRSLIVLNAFEVEQFYGSAKDKWVLQKENLSWRIETNSRITEGLANVLFTEYSFDSTYSKRFFNAEVGVTQDSAYQRDTGYWATIRPLPLTNDESKFIAYQDSLLRVMNSTSYLDSIDSVFNRLTIPNLLWDGQGHINRDKKEMWRFDPALAMINPMAIGGFRLRYSVSFEKTFESRKKLYVAPLLNYGFRNNDMKGGGTVNLTYNPMRLARLNLSYYNEFGIVNQFATIQDILSRANFFETKTIRLGHSVEVFNGLYFGTSISSNIRRSLQNFSFNPEFDSTFNNANRPLLDFEPNGSSVVRIGLTYTPKQLYIQEPKEKIVLGSRWPTFSLYYEQAVPRLFGATTDFKYLEFGVNQKINLGIFGISEYNIQVGSFLDTTKMLPMDNRFIRGGDPYFFIPPMFGYQLIDSTFSVFNVFYESHYNHEFNGFLMSKIPGLKQLNIRTSAGGGLLIVPEHRFRYAELHLGASRLFRIGKLRYKFGTYYVVSQSNRQGFRSRFKFLITPWNAENSSWAF